MILLAAMFSFARAAAQDRSAGAGFAWNEFTASFQIRMNDDGFLRTSLNLDMTDVISGKSLYPGFSADAAYLFEFAEKRFLNGEYFTFFAGPGICAGYVRNVSGDFGIMGALSGCIGSSVRVLAMPPSSMIGARIPMRWIILIMPWML